MSEHKVYIDFPGRIVLIGFGSIGQGVLPLVLRHVGIPADRITIVTAEDRGIEEAKRYGVRFVREVLVRENFRRVLEPLVGRGDFVLNVSVDVSSIALIKYCWERGAMYLDTCIEPWAGGYTDPGVPAARRTNYALREEALALRPGNAKSPTAVITHGANPGLVSHFVKQALLNLAADTGVDAGAPATREDWAGLAQTLGVRVIHIAERDTQVSPVRKKKNEFVNTWSVDGFVGEGQQPCELGWGSHERNFPRDGRRHDFAAGNIFGFAITHGESISIADFLTIRDGGQVVYRPTVHYAYHPCDDAVLSMHEFVGRNCIVQDSKRILMDEISPGGIDELGVLLAGHRKNAYWFGSQLTVDEARQLAPYNNATSLQVTVSCLAGMIWAMENPNRGLVEPDELDFRRVLEICADYLGPVAGEYTDWTPLSDRERLFPEDIDKTDPWQFKNVRVF